MLGEVLAEQLGCVDGHRTVEVDRNVGDPVLRAQHAHQKENALRTSDRKNRHENRAAAVKCAVDYVR